MAIQPTGAEEQVLQAALVDGMQERPEGSTVTVDPVNTPADLDLTPVELSPARSRPGSARLASLHRLLSVVVAVLMLAGMGSLAVVEPGDGEPLTALALAASAEEAARFSTVTVEISSSATGSGTTAEMSLSIRIDSDRRIAAMTLSSPGLPGEGLESIMADGVLAFDLGPNPPPSAGGRRWVGWRLPEAVADDPWAATGSRMLDQLQGATGEPTLVGTEEVRGVPTSHYRVDIDVAKVAAEIAAHTEASGLPVGPVPPSATIPAQMDVWIDDDRLIRRTLIEKTMPTGPITGFRSQADYFGYGEPIDVQPPAEDDVLVVDSIAQVMTILVSARTG